MSTPTSASDATQRQPTPIPPPRAPRTFIRLLPSSGDTLLLQTAVTTYTSAHQHQPHNRILHIHSLVHIADPQYYHHLTTSLEDLTGTRSAVVLYELITTLDNVVKTPYPRLRRRAYATNAARAAAKSLRAVPQADALDATQPHWRFADLPLSPTSTWSSPTHPSPTPPSLLAIVITFIATFLPCPELFVAFGDITTGYAALPPITLLMLALTSNSTLADVRRLAFASRLAETVEPLTTPADCQRNATAWQNVVTVFQPPDENSFPIANAIGPEVSPRTPAITEAALLFGAWHSPALCSCAETDGWRFAGRTWHTAMTVHAPTNSISRYAVAATAAVAAVAYAIYAAVDWVGLVDHIAQAFQQPDVRRDVALQVALYVARHAAPYVVFRRWFRVWGSS